jgi:thiol-disulfide isomerase/thioredoxin
MNIKNIILIVTGLLPLAVMAQSGYTLSGKISGLHEPSTIYLALQQGGSFTNKDSTEIRNGEFRFQGTVSAPTLAILSVKGINSQAKARPDQLALYIENSKISISAADSIKNAVVSGSVSDRQNREQNAMIKPLTDIIIKLNNEFRGKPKDETYIKASDSVASLVAAIKNIHLKFAESHLHSYIGLYTYNVYVLDTKFDPAKVEPLFHQFSSELQSSELGKRTLEKIEIGKRRQTGIKATDFTQNDLNDKPFTLASLRGKYVLVDFWASWCAPCRAENPNLIKAYQQLKGRNFEVVSVSLDQARGPWEGAVKQDHLPWIHVCDLKGWKNDVAVMYGINSVPQNLLINPEGVIIAKNLRGTDLTDKLSAFIK